MKFAGQAVHPRVCGEHLVGMGYVFDVGGSSPRVRGTLLPPPRIPAAGRFIPACAGNTPKRVACACCRAVHPRVCGEHACGNGLF